MTVHPHRSACVRKFLDLSSFHIKPETCEALAGMGLESLMIGQCGFMIPVPDKDSVEREDYPLEMVRAFKVAWRNYPDVDYLCFDADAPENPDFPFYADHWA